MVVFVEPVRASRTFEAVIDKERLAIHRRQVEAMRGQNPEALAAVLDGQVV